MRNVWIIAAYEFPTTVRRLGYVITAFVLPIGIMGISLGATWIAGLKQMEQVEAMHHAVAVVDEAGILEGDPPEGVRVFVSVAQAQAEVPGGRVGLIVVLPPSYLETGTIALQAPSEGMGFAMQGGLRVPETVRRWLVRSLAGNEVDAVRRARLEEPVTQTRTVFLDPATGRESAEDMTAKAARLALAIGFLVVMSTTTMMTGAYLLQGVAEEKENRVMEMVLCSVSTDQLMAGKLLGLGAAGILQFAVWFAMGAAALAVFGLAGMLDVSTLAALAGLFVLGYGLYGALLLATGSFGSNMREVSQWAGIWTMVSVLPFLLIQILITEPHGTLARVLSYIPLTAAATAALRHGADPLPAWEVALVFAILGVSTWLSVRAAAKVFRVGVLMYGKRPTPREIWRWLRAR